MAVIRWPSSTSTARISLLVAAASGVTMAEGVRPSALRRRDFEAAFSFGWARPARSLQAATRQALPQYFCPHRLVGVYGLRQYLQAC
jgi:hypothetical protein